MKEVVSEMCIAVMLRRRLIEARYTDLRPSERAKVKRDVQAQIEALAAAGYVIVPKVPTPEMIAAGTAADWVGEAEGRAGESIMKLTEGWRFEQLTTLYETECEDNPDPPKLFAELASPGIWAAMLAAAPKPR